MNENELAIGISFVVVSSIVAGIIIFKDTMRDYNSPLEKEIDWTANYESLNASETFDKLRKLKKLQTTCCYCRSKIDKDVNQCKNCGATKET